MPLFRLFFRLLLVLMLTGAAVLYPSAVNVFAQESTAASAPFACKPVQAVDRIAMTVSDIDRAVAFYTQVLSFQEVSDAEIFGQTYERLTGVFGARLRVVTLQLGDEQLELTQFLTPRGRSIPEDARSNDGSFQHVAIVVSDMQKAFQTLQKATGPNKLRYVSTGPQLLPDWNKAAGGIEAFYFQDPDGHNLELIHFPPGKGDPKWQQLAQKTSPKLFVGIDHTAIVVSDTAKSRVFYQQLGLKLAGESTNYGLEQAHLNLVEDAKLHISSLRPAKGPGIELLEYLNPKTGRPISADAKTNDISHWHVRLMADDTACYAKILHPNPGQERFSKWMFRTQDPDGHVLELEAPEN